MSQIVLIFTGAHLDRSSSLVNLLTDVSEQAVNLSDQNVINNHIQNCIATEQYKPSTNLTAVYVTKEKDQILNNGNTNNKDDDVSSMSCSLSESVVNIELMDDCEASFKSSYPDDTVAEMFKEGNNNFSSSAMKYTKQNAVVSAGHSTGFYANNSDILPLMAGPSNCVSGTTCDKCIVTHIFMHLYITMLSIV